MIDFKLNGKKVSIPSHFDDLTMKQYLSWLNGEITDTAGAIAIFTGLDAELVRKSVIVGLDKVIGALSFMNQKAEFTGTCDKVGQYKIPTDKGQFNIQFETVAQFEDMRAIIKSCPDIKAITNAYPKIIAIYLQKIRDGEYDYSKAQLMAEEVLAMPAKEVITVGAFFYVKLTSLLRGTPTTSLPTNQSPKKSKLGLRKSVKRSARR